MERNNEFSSDKPCFDILLPEEQDKLMENRKAQSTNRATKQWVNALKEFIKERGLTDLDLTTNAELPKMISDFYFSMRKQPNKEPKKRKK